MSSQPRLPLRILLVGADEEVQVWFQKGVKSLKLPCRLRMTNPLRICAPENQLEENDLIILVWEQTEPSQGSILDVMKKANPPRTRSMEGALHDLERSGGEMILRRTVALGRFITREDTVMLAESGIRHVFPLPQKRSHWDIELPEILEKMERHVRDERETRQSAEETAVRHFLGLLHGWDKVSDEMKMTASENILKALGDSSRYAELVARKCLAEKNFKGAERWLQRAISKNPNYLKALQLLSDVYMYTGRFDDALAVMERLRANNPKNIARFVKIGRCYLLKGEFEKADKAFEDALKIDCYSQDAREELGKVRCLLGDFESAKLLFIDSRNERQLAIFLNRLGIKMVEDGKFEESINHYTRAQYVLPGNTESHCLFLNIGLAYAKWGRFREALRYARLALAREPGYDKAVQLVSWIEQRKSA